jgi:Recombination endonuclease VII
MPTARKPRRAAALGVDDAEYARLLAAQNGVCAICGDTPKRVSSRGKLYRLHVDHERPSGRVRGLLCYRCNRALPSYVTMEWLAKAIRYLWEAKSARWTQP